MYLNGRGVARDYKEALKWIKLAAEQGNADAQYALGLMYKDGIGVRRNEILSYRYLKKAVKNGKEEATDVLSALCAKSKWACEE